MFIHENSVKGWPQAFSNVSSAYHVTVREMFWKNDEMTRKDIWYLVFQSDEVKSNKNLVPTICHFDEIFPLNDSGFSNSYLFVILKWNFLFKFSSCSENC